MKLKIYEPSMQPDIEAFYCECYSALKWGYDPHARHADTVNIPEEYQKSGQFWCLYDEDVLVGTAAVRTIDTENKVAELKRLYVLPSRKGEGFGTLLFETALQYTKDAGFAKICADTRLDHNVSQHLMRSHGFKECARYNDNAFAELFFELDLKPQSGIPPMTEKPVSHPFDAIADKKSRILILGTMPSVKSREVNFYYSHPRNRFWQVIAECFGQPLPDSIDKKTRLLLENGIALWDVLAACRIVGSDDSSIRSPVYNDIAAFISDKPIVKILCNGTKAYQLCRGLNLPLPVLCMPSTSPANAKWSTGRLIETWKLELVE